MRPYETELIARCLSVLEEAIEQKGNIDTPAVRLALWALRPYCDPAALKRFWLVTKGQNPMWAQGVRGAALSIVKAGIYPHDTNTM